MITVFALISPKTLSAYSTTHNAVIANIKTGEAFLARCGLSRTHDYMLGIRFLDPQKNLFVIVKSIDEGGSGWEDYLYIAKLEDREFVDTGWVMKIGVTDYPISYFQLYHTWFVHERKLFVYDQGQMLCTDGNRPISHPFLEIFRANSGHFGKIKDTAIHPKLPFGIMIEERTSGSVIHGLIVVRWDTTKPKKQVVVYGTIFESLALLFDIDGMALAYQSFSPDGKWYVVGCIKPDSIENPSNPHFIAIPITPANNKHSNFLDMDNLLVLGQVADMISIAWTSEPTSYVVSNGELLYKWDLDELPNARVFVVPEAEAERKKVSIWGRIARFFGWGK